MMVLLHSIWIFGLAYFYILWRQPSLQTVYKTVVAGLLVWLGFCLFPASDISFVLNGSLPNNYVTNDFWKYLYVIGFSIQLIRHLYAWMHAQKIKSQAFYMFDQKVADTLKQLKERFNHKVNINIKFHHSIDAPMVIGFFKPMILFPVSLMSQWTPEQIEAILLHELQHIQQRDYLWNLIMVALETILFFNPFIYLLRNHIRIQREIHADAQAVKWSGQPQILATTLLQLEEARAKKRLSISLNDSDLSLRVKQLFCKESSRLSPRWSKGVYLSIVFTAGMYFSQFYEEKSKFIYQAHFDVNTDIVVTAPKENPPLKTDFSTLHNVSFNQNKREIRIMGFEEIDDHRLAVVMPETTKKGHAQSNEQLKIDRSEQANKELQIDWSAIEGYQFGKSRVNREEFAELIIAKKIDHSSDSQNNSIIIKMDTDKMGKNKTIDIDINAELSLLISLLKSDLTLQEGVADILRYYVDASITQYEILIVGDSVYYGDDELDDYVSNLIIKYVQSKEVSSSMDGQIFFKIINNNQ